VYILKKIPIFVIFVKLTTENMKTGLKIFLKVIIALILIVPLLAYSLSVILAILTFVIALAIFVKLSGGKVNFKINQKTGDSIRH
jgi:cellulose synthase/poly-beta-1,6-N-acetylglucosamine synthase-like glycosyltransferase